MSICIESEETEDLQIRLTLKSATFSFCFLVALGIFAR
jgi:hypothetical protein